MVIHSLAAKLKIGWWVYGTIQNFGGTKFSRYYSKYKFDG